MATVILENAKWLWTDEEIEQCTALWMMGADVYQIAKQMKENPDDIGLLIIHLGQVGKLRREL